MPKWRAALIGALTLSACAAGELGAQQPGLVTGRVTDALGSQPIESADVFVVGTQLISVTDADGVYSLAQVPSGTVAIRVERLGYLAQNRSIDVSVGATATEDFSLEVSAVALDAVVVTATGPQRRREIGNSAATLQAARELET